MRPSLPASFHQSLFVSQVICIEFSEAIQDDIDIVLATIRNFMVAKQALNASHRFACVALDQFTGVNIVVRG